MPVSTTTTTPTGWAADASYNNWLQAQQAINRPYQAYPGNMLAGFQPMQNQAIQQTGQQYGGAAMQAGSNAAQNAANYQASMVNPQMANTYTGTVTNYDSALAGPAAMASAAEMGRGQVRDVAAKDFLSRDINAYMNPYINTVINNSMADLSRQNDIVNNQTNARAAAAGAFGGSRQAVANTLNNENFLRESGNLSGNLRNQGYNTAAQLIGQDNDRDLQAQQANQGMDWNVGSLNTNIAHDINQLNANALNTRAQYNATNQQQANMNTAGAHNDMTARNMAALNGTALQNADLDLRGQGLNQAAGQNAANSWVSAGNALNNMGLNQQTWNSNNADALWGMGARQQLQEQAGVTDAYNRWLAEYNYPMTQVDQRRAALQGAPIGESKATPYYDNTAANVLAGGLGAAQLASKLPGAINGVSAGYNALSGLFGGGGALASGTAPSGTLIKGVTGLLGGRV